MLKKMVALLMALLLAGCALAECPEIAVNDYPKVDGSTATLPLSYRLMEAATGVDEAAAKIAIRHNKTTESFYALVYGEADTTVPYRENGIVLERLYRERGLPLFTAGKPGCGHHPHGLENPKPLADFIEAWAD